MSSFGESLRRERELRQISLREIAEATKINLRYLEALERNDFRHLPGGVFNKGFVKAYAQFIGVDPDAMTTAYLAEEQRQLADAGKTAPAEAQSDRLEATGPVPSRLWLVVVIVLLVLLLMGAGLTALGYGPLASKFKAIRSAILVEDADGARS
ncbi:MAG TPA: helix-turn-helix transcriptional regulator [Candidatus Polarisedimenticolaceae bacterium]|nr:helix-turn-helix transcriptional regulator [Candidatus Polarisedimenticolaceae bacterium]